MCRTYSKSWRETDRLFVTCLLPGGPAEGRGCTLTRRPLGVKAYIDKEPSSAIHRQNNWPTKIHPHQAKERELKNEMVQVLQLFGEVHQREGSKLGDGEGKPEQQKTIAIAASTPMLPDDAIPCLVVRANLGTEVAKKDEAVKLWYSSDHAVEVIVELVLDFVGVDCGRSVS
ncbi:hypothetical protein Y1Q_0018192 [Alligator mississippiensis]|uniref:Uncharacterized protein n=1 Tax=Alligator mississippiensis TaxID=8496 RepID=A0A151MR66_ALLMI|nr:hypothetical protein Y1Q_0018192 [Alligator mississippiensis]